MVIATLGIVIQDGQLLLGEKKKGEIGTGILSGPGGKLDPGETLQECLLRETREELEVELDLASLELTAYVIFHKGRTWFMLLNRILDYCGLRSSTPDFEVYVYYARILSGTLAETKEMIPGWYHLDDLPFGRMYEADCHWFPAMLRGEKFCANVHYFGRAKGFNRIEFSSFVF